jgi:hypothetical protein
MKTLLRIFALFVLINGLALTAPGTASANGTTISLQVFYDQLSPYGTWIYDPQFGYVWLPSEGPGFYPYETGGHWLLTDYGWTWVSDYSWGWAPFHYGRWYFDTMYGWLWIPGDDWGPAWVNWRMCDGYYGWAPMAPGFRMGFSFGRRYELPPERWVFVQNRYLMSHEIRHYAIDHSGNRSLMSHSTVITNTREDNQRNVRFYSGPDPKQVERITGEKIRPVRVNESARPEQRVSNDQLKIYRPEVEKKATGTREIAPKHFARYNDLKQSPAKNEVNRERTQTQPATERVTSRQSEKAVTPKQESPVRRTEQPSVNQGRENKLVAQPRHPANVRQERKMSQPAAPAPAHPAGDRVQRNEQHFNHPAVPPEGKRGNEIKSAPSKPSKEEPAHGGKRSS